MSCRKIKFDPITDLSHYVGKDHYQAKLDDKSGYDHIKLTQESKTFFGLRWKNWYFVYNTIPFGWSPSAYIYQTVGLAASHFIRSNGVPVTQYIDDRHIGQLLPAKTVITNWSDLELANAAVFISSLSFVSGGYFIGLQKSVLCQAQSILFLGLISNSQDQSFSIPQDKKKNLRILGNPSFAQRMFLLKRYSDLEEKLYLSPWLSLPHVCTHVKLTRV